MADGGGVAGRLRMFFAPRFLNRGWVSEGLCSWSNVVSMRRRLICHQRIVE